MARPRKVLVDDEKSAKAAAKQAQEKAVESGAEVAFYNIERRIPGSEIWEDFEMGIPVGKVDNITAFCRKKGGTQYEYKLSYHDADNKPIRGTSPTIIRATSFTPPAEEDGAGDFVKSAEQDLRDRERELKLRSRAARIAREEQRIARLEQESASLGDADPRYLWMDYDTGYANQRVPPWMLQRQQGNNEALAAALNTLGTVVAAALQPRDNGNDLLKVLLPVMMAQGMKPGDMLGLIGPVIETLGKTQASAASMVLENAQETNRMALEKVLDMMGPQEKDEIDKWRKIIGLGTDALGGVAKAVFNRNSIMPGQQVDVPKLPASQARPAVPGLPKPAPKPEAQESNPSPAQPKQVAPIAGEAVKPEGDPQNPALAEAKRVQALRVQAFVKVHEQEMLVGSNPAAVVEKIDELFAFLPADLRDKIEAEEAEAGDIYDALRVYAPEEVARILAAVEADKAGKFKAWCIDFWMAYQPGDEEEEEPDDEGPDEGDDEPEPAPPEPVAPQDKEAKP